LRRAASSCSTLTTSKSNLFREKRTESYFIKKYFVKRWSHFWSLK
jgi:hypothetical protein